MIGLTMKKTDWFNFLFYVLGVVTTAGFTVTGLLIERQKIVKRMKRNDNFGAQMEALMEKFSKLDKDDIEGQNEISEQIVELMGRYGM